MQLTIQLFAGAREAAGDRVEISLSEPATVAAVLQALSDLPALASVAARSRLAVDQRFGAPDEVVRPDQELALIPPVGGG